MLSLQAEAQPCTAEASASFSTPPKTPPALSDHLVQLKANLCIGTKYIKQHIARYQVYTAIVAGNCLNTEKLSATRLLTNTPQMVWLYGYING